MSSNVVTIPKQATAIQTNFAPSNFQELIKFAVFAAKTSFVPTIYQNSPETILIAVQMGAELGLAPMQSLQNIAVINGKPSIYGDAMLAVCKASPLCEWVKEEIKGDKKEEWVAICTVKRRGNPEVISTFSWQDAIDAKLTGKVGPWTSYPKRMLKMRARGFALRDAFPDLLSGLISQEEAQDYPTQQNDQSVHLEEKSTTIPTIDKTEDTQNHQRNTNSMDLDERIEKTITAIRNKQTKNELDILSSKWDEAVGSCKQKGKPIPDEKVSLVAQEFMDAYERVGLNEVVDAEIIQEMPHAS
ncbi:unnamed protein product [Commensalibacter communis]|uniref:recombinase RecT n=1 Tax=Commensalibacter communis TaxID=2972786 RepID=UPI0022FF6D49|nr:recombinase RecT [Commensalibacter communis]CAI3953563.1 unnamed protein product [Commensalibacter communis]CAI3959212.1 unnamed protein product [Commensalibacter communis]